MLCTYKLAWILNSLLNIWLWLTKPMFPVFFHPSNLKSIRTKTAPRSPWKKLHQVLLAYPDGSEPQGLEPWINISDLKKPQHPLLWSDPLHCFLNSWSREGQQASEGPCDSVQGQAPAGFSRLVLDQSQISSTKAGAASLLLFCPGLIPIYPNWVDVVYLHSLGNPTAVPVFARHLGRLLISWEEILFSGTLKA